MLIFRHRVGDMFTSHDLHRDTVGKTVSFVWTGSVQLESSSDFHSRVCDYGAHCFNCAVSEPLIGGEERQELRLKLLPWCRSALVQDIRRSSLRRDNERPSEPSKLSNRRCRRKQTSLISLRCPVKVMIVLTRSIGRKLGADFIGHVCPNVANSGRDRASGGFRRGGRRLLRPRIWNLVLCQNLFEDFLRGTDFCGSFGPCMAWRAAPNVSGRRMVSVIAAVVLPNYPFSLPTYFTATGNTASAMANFSFSRPRPEALEISKKGRLRSWATALSAATDSGS